MLLSLVGDALWIIAMSIMASATLAAWRRIDPRPGCPCSSPSAARRPSG
uniref:Uncharacterized protein n=1 Tax=Phenylobacterium glaciei TaxID=2803784 RepID=A0A974P549_9CAUL|nr:hypothetical protein JKL49_03325 [Phenylobacterium glaciei]